AIHISSLAIIRGENNGRPALSGRHARPLRFLLLALKHLQFGGTKMGFKEQGKRALIGARGAVAVAFGAVAMMIGAPTMAQQQPLATYSFQGLSWGMKSADAQKALAQHGFQVTGQAIGKRREFAIDRLHAVYSVIDRGKRVFAVGKFEGYPVTVEL